MITQPSNSKQPNEWVHRIGGKRRPPPGDPCVMPTKTVNSPPELVKRLIEIFPAFAGDWDQGEGFGYSKGEYSYHSVFLTLGPKSLKLLSEATRKQMQEFCALIDYSVERGSDLENAASTCFLEHASQLGVRKLIQPFLSRKAEGQLV